MAKTDAINVSFIIEASKLGCEYNRSGFVCHPQGHTTDAVPMGIRSWPAAFSYPKDPPIQEHWPNIISVIYEQADGLNKFRDPITFFDKKVQCTYFLSKIEPAMIFLAIYDKKKDTDTNIKDFMNNIANYLRGFKYPSIIHFAHMTLEISSNFGHIAFGWTRNESILSSEFIEDLLSATAPSVHNVTPVQVNDNANVMNFALYKCCAHPTFNFDYLFSSLLSCEICCDLLRARNSWGLKMVARLSISFAASIKAACTSLLCGFSFSRLPK